MLKKALVLLQSIVLLQAKVLLQQQKRQKGLNLSKA